MNAAGAAMLLRTALCITLPLSCCTRTARTSAHGESQRVPDEPPLIEFRLVRAVSFPDAVVQVYRGDTIYLEARPILSDPDLRVVQPDLGEGRLIISFEATEEAGRRYRLVTAAHVGERLALLLEGNIANIVAIRSSLGARGVADAHMPREQATRLAILIQNRWRYPRVGRDTSSRAMASRTRLERNVSTLSLRPVTLAARPAGQNYGVRLLDVGAAGDLRIYLDGDFFTTHLVHERALIECVPSRTCSCRVVWFLGNPFVGVASYTGEG